MINAVGPVSLPDELYGGGFFVKEVFGLPLHPLVVHAAVVLIPLAALGLIVMVSGATRSRRFGGAVTLLAVLGATSAFVAMASGRDLAERFGYGEQRHFELGGWMPWVGLALLATTALLWLLDKRSPSRGMPGKVVALLALGVAVGAVAMTVVTGHLGAELTWGAS